MTQRQHRQHQKHTAQNVSPSVQKRCLSVARSPHMSHHILSILQRLKFFLLLLLLLFLALRGKQVHTVLHHCATLIQHPKREIRAPSRSSARHHPRYELLDTMRASTTRFCSPTIASLSTRDHQRHQPTHAHSVLVSGGGGRSCLRLGALGSGALLCPALQRASKQRDAARTATNTHKLTKAAFAFRPQRLFRGTRTCT